MYNNLQCPMLTKDDYQELKNAAFSFLHDDSFGLVEIEEVMLKFFGSQDEREKNEEAKAWALYWTALSIHKEIIRDGLGDPMPVFPAASLSGDSEMEVDGSTSSQSQLSNTLLQNPDDRATERENRRVNNISPRKVNGVGKPLDDLSGRLMIVRHENNSKGKPTQYYYCIACDNRQANGSRSRILDHASACQALQREWPNEYNEVQNALCKNSGENTATGKAPAPAVREKKRKLENENEGRVPVAFATTTPASSSSSESRYAIEFYTNGTAPEVYEQKLGIKLFSVSPSEMCDEQDASRTSGFNTAKRNGLTGKNIIRMVQLQQYWRYGFLDRKYSHSASLSLPKLKVPSDSIQLPAPTLNDLLNPADPLEPEESMFDVRDPYGVEKLERDEADDDLDESPWVSRVGSLERLEIENLVDLNAPKLRARFEERLAVTKPITKDKSSEASTSTAVKWTDKDAQWDAKGISW
ncbi:hypothetical protein BDP27DRAFT_1371607 [Rhodocollybia butyracea]|uniref:Uncharacterized protein n=1 Tax=Rhodocollybia butyracea TaxID=206335 RepID=A0A9P5PBS3_9AGAR|nr:hypothetical protein BDP27DRAFT_1371607 [Rhodocollybia butyracea]